MIKGEKIQINIENDKGSSEKDNNLECEKSFLNFLGAFDLKEGVLKDFSDVEKINNVDENIEAEDIKKNLDEFNNRFSNEFKGLRALREGDVDNIRKEIKKRKIFSAIKILSVVSMMSFSLGAKAENLDEKSFLDDNLKKELSDYSLDESPRDSVEFFKAKYIKDIDKFKDLNLIEKESYVNDSILDLKQYFKHNSSEISQEGEKEIISLVTDFFVSLADSSGNIDNDKLKQFLDSDVEILSSSNELKRNLPGGNEALSLNRGVALKEAIENNLDIIINNLNKLSLNLSDENIEDTKSNLLKAKIIYPIYDEQGKENGVTYINSLTNPETNMSYTDSEVDEIKNNNEELYKELLEKCRVAKINLQAGNSKGVIESDINKNVEGQEAFNREKEKLKEYENIYMLFDNSRSSNFHNEAFVNKTEKILEGIKLDDNASSNLENVIIGFWGNGLKEETVKSYDFDNCKEAIEYAKSGNDHGGGSTELAVDSAIELLDNFSIDSAGGKSLIYISTDEILQGLSLNKLKELKEKTEESEADIIFILKPKNIVKEGKEIEVPENGFEVSLDDVMESFENDETFLRGKNSIEKEENAVLGSCRDKLNQAKNFREKRKLRKRLIKYENYYHRKKLEHDNSLHNLKNINKDGYGLFFDSSLK